MRKTITVLVVMLCLTALLFAQGKQEASASDAKVLRVAMECGYAPYNWTQTTNANGAVPMLRSKELHTAIDFSMMAN